MKPEGNNQVHLILITMSYHNIIWQNVLFFYIFGGIELSAVPYFLEYTWGVFIEMLPL